jgi:hypothetical protein
VGLAKIARLGVIHHVLENGQTRYFWKCFDETFVSRFHCRLPSINDERSASIGVNESNDLASPEDSAVIFLHRTPIVRVRLLPLRGLFQFYECATKPFAFGCRITPMSSLAFAILCDTTITQNAENRVESTQSTAISFCEPQCPISSAWVLEPSCTALSNRRLKWQLPATQRAYHRTWDASPSRWGLFVPR